MSEINKIRRKLIVESNVGAAIRCLRAVLTENPFVVSGVLRQRLENLESDYQRMCDFMLHGYRDDQREEVYRSLLRRMADLLGDFELAELQATNATFGTAAKNHPDLTDDYDTVRQMLEGYVQNLAMLSLEPEEQAESRLQTLHDEHLKQLDTLFNALLSSRQWSSGKKSFYTELLLSPTIDNGDAALLISAVMLSAMAVADIAKLEMLFEVYRRATDEIRRQRALVGLAFALPDKDFNKIFPEYDQLVEQLCADEQTRKELADLQKQIFLCMDADRDRLIVILAGGAKELKQFLDANSSLSSRFTYHVDFPDYNADELFQIFEVNCQKHDYVMTDEAKFALKSLLEKAVTVKDKNFGNARYVRNLFEKTVERQANRLSKQENLSKEMLTEITIEDLNMNT